jgi:hypothetical protein
MFQFNYKLKVAERVKAKCERHPRYNPEREGRGGIKGGCSTCFSLFDLHQARLSLDAAHREFLDQNLQPRRPPKLDASIARKSSLNRKLRDGSASEGPPFAAFWRTHDGSIQLAVHTPVQKALADRLDERLGLES